LKGVENRTRTKRKIPPQRGKLHSITVKNWQVVKILEHKELRE